MRYRLACLIAVILLPAFAGTDALAQKRSKKHTHGGIKQSAQSPARSTDISSPAPGAVTIPQQRSLIPELKKTKKVVIVPAPPPPPGPDPVPPYPKR